MLHCCQQHWPGDEPSFGHMDTADTFFQLRFLERPAECWVNATPSPSLWRGVNREDAGRWKMLATPLLGSTADSSRRCTVSVTFPLPPREGLNSPSQPGSVGGFPWRPVDPAGRAALRWEAGRKMKCLQVLMKPDFVCALCLHGWGAYSFPEARTDCGTRVGAGSEVFLCSPGLSGNNMNMNLWGFGFGFVGAFWSY